MTALVAVAAAGVSATRAGALCSDWQAANNTVARQHNVDNFIPHRTAISPPNLQVRSVITIRLEMGINRVGMAAVHVHESRKGAFMKNVNPEHAEGGIARAIEQETAKLPSDWFLWAACGAIATSLTLRIAGQKHAANFVGEWAPTILILGLYNKIVKVMGSD
jgi:hypothetical protein